jgi:hypothetical protein
MYCSCYVTLPPSTRKKEGKKRRISKEKGNKGKWGEKKGKTIVLM